MSSNSTHPLRYWIQKFRHRALNIEIFWISLIHAVFGFFKFRALNIEIFWIPLYMQFLWHHILLQIIAVIDFLSRLRRLLDLLKSFTTYSRCFTEDANVMSYNFRPTAECSALFFSACGAIFVWIPLYMQFLGFRIFGPRILKYSEFPYTCSFSHSTLVGEWNYNFRVGPEGAAWKMRSIPLRVFSLLFPQ